MSYESLCKFKFGRNENSADTIAIQKKDIVIRLSDATLKAMDWKAGDKIDVERGHGEHKGLVRLSANPRGWKLYYPTKLRPGHNITGLVLKLGKAVGGRTFFQIPDHLCATALQTVRRGGALEFRLPWMAPDRSESDEAVAKGFPVTQCPPSMPNAKGPIPVRGKARPFAGGRV